MQSTLTHPSPRLIDAAALAWTSLPAGDAVERITGEGRGAANILPPTLRSALEAFAVESDVSGALLIRGIPLGDIGPTPDSPATASLSAEGRWSEHVLLAAACAVGEPVGYLPEHGGRLVQHIAPVRGTEVRQVSTSSRTTLMFHTEAAFHPHMPSHLLLLCLRGNPQARTTLCSIRHLVGLMRPETLDVLSQKRFRTKPDESYVGGPSTTYGPPVAVLTGTVEAPTLLFDQDLMIGIDEAAQHALDDLAAAVEMHHGAVTLEPGDLLVVDNSVAVHGRTAFVARFDGTDRWLQRTFTVRTLAPSAAERNGRVIATRFS